MYLLLLLVPIPFPSFRAYAKKTGKMWSFYEGQRPLIPSFILFALFYFWAYISPYGILQKEPRLCMLTIGTVFSSLSVSI